jgi:hypothetical protein
MHLHETYIFFLLVSLQGVTQPLIELKMPKESPAVAIKFSKAFVKSYKLNVVKILINFRQLREVRVWVSSVETPNWYLIAVGGHCARCAKWMPRPRTFTASLDGGCLCSFCDLSWFCNVCVMKLLHECVCGENIEAAEEQPDVLSARRETPITVS